MIACYRSTNLPSSRKVPATSMRFPRTVAHRGGGSFKGATVKPILKVGDRFGRLVVICKTQKQRGERIQNAWYCRCDCGNEVSHFTSNLRSGNTRSCGCLLRDILPTVNYRHGESHSSPEYRAWKAMRTRARNPNIPGAQWYNLKGVKCCKRWNDYRKFLADMGRKPTPRHTLDRINSNGDYKPSNCRWATYAEQMVNKTKNRHLTFRGVTKAFSQWEAQYGIRGNQLYARINRGWSVEKALTTPVGRKKFIPQSDADEIRKLAGKIPYRRLATMFKIHRNTVGEIVRREKHWRSVPAIIPNDDGEMK